MSRSRPGPEPGTYALILRARALTDVRIGRLGRLRLEPGWLVYVGSAFGPGGLRARLAHHLGLAERPRWHVDWLRRRADVDEVWWTADRRRQEHRWARCLRAHRGARVPLAGFGSSDCDCLTHLLGFRRRPAIGWLRRRLRAGDRSHAPVHAWRSPA